MGVLALAISMYGWHGRATPFTKGWALALMLVALIQLTVGGSIFVRSPQDIARVKQIIQQEPARLQSEEIPRMQVAMKNFTLYKYLEIALIVLGALFFFALHNDWWRGLGLGLMIQAAIMLRLDLIAAQRGSAYLDYLTQGKF
jgi:hypothetical protein